jgi:pimeloyl-ACP methyl ester carboxylesterase
VSFLTTREGVRLRYTDRGSSERTVVLVHGWKGSHRMWDPAVYRLSGEFRVIAFDNRGMGESDKPGGAYDFEVLADDLGFVLAELGARDVTLVGWSMGCSISLEYLARGGDRAARLVLVNGPVKLTQTPEFPWTMTEAEVNAYVDDVVARWPAAEREFANVSLLPRDADSDFAQLYTAVALQTPLELAVRIVREQLKLDHIGVLKSLTIPVLAIYGRHDPFYPVELAEWIAANARHGEHAIFEESAHAVHFDEPERFAEVVGEFARRSTV